MQESSIIDHTWAAATECNKITEPGGCWFPHGSGLISFLTWFWGHFSENLDTDSRSAAEDSESFLGGIASTSPRQSPRSGSSQSERSEWNFWLKLQSLMFILSHVTFWGVLSEENFMKKPTKQPLIPQSLVGTELPAFKVLELDSRNALKSSCI